MYNKYYFDLCIIFILFWWLFMRGEIKKWCLFDYEVLKNFFYNCKKYILVYFEMMDKLENI